MNNEQLKKAALRGEPSYVWRAGQERRLRLIMDAAGDRANGVVFIDGCGVGNYLSHLAPYAVHITGIDIDFDRCRESWKKVPVITCAAGECLPFSGEQFDLVLSHEVLEHVQDDFRAVKEIVRLLRPGGRLVLFLPNRGYPFETHGIYWHGQYHFGNFLLVNYLPDIWRDRLAPHVRVYTGTDLERLFSGLPVKFIERRVIFGAYDNIIHRFPLLGRVIRRILQALESTPLSCLGLSHFCVIEKI